MRRELDELKQLIRDTDREIRETFEATFNAAAANFEELAEHVFPGGRGRLRLVREDAGPRPVLGGAQAGRAVDWLLDQQKPDGSFGGGTSTEGPNANSTGVAAQARAAPPGLGLAERSKAFGGWGVEVGLRGGRRPSQRAAARGGRERSLRSAGRRSARRCRR